MMFAKYEVGKYAQKRVFAVSRTVLEICLSIASLSFVLLLLLCSTQSYEKKKMSMM